MMQQNRFFAQSYADTLNDYMYSCKEGRGENWDWIVLTAANKRQAEAYELQIEKRKAKGRLPLRTRFMVVPDYMDQRIGSGGATLNVIRYLVEEEGYKDFSDRKILVIHSGGDSKRIPQYSMCGKLFAPVPRQLPGGDISTIFDELLILAAGIPGRIGKGIMIFPSDTELLFNPLQLDLKSCDAAGLSIKASVLEGQEHGVYLQGKGTEAVSRSRNVSRFLHKLPEHILRQVGAVDDQNQVDIDSGCIWLGERIVREMADLIYTWGKLDNSRFIEFVSPDVCLNLYADFVYPLAEGSTLEEFLEEQPETSMSEKLLACRKQIWDRLHIYHMSLVKIVPARYIHFGMTHEMYDLFVCDIDSYSFLGWDRRIGTNAEKGTVLNSCVGPEVILEENAFIEDSLIEGNVQIGEGTVVSGVDIAAGEIHPDTVISAVKLKDERFVCRIYGREDNPKASKSARFLNGSIEKLIQSTGTDHEEIWGTDPASIWNARIFPARRSMKEAVESALTVYKIINGAADEAEIKEWRASDRYSLGSSFMEADVPAMLKRQSDIRQLVKLNIFFRDIADGREMKKCMEVLCQNLDSDEINNFVDRIAEEAGKRDFPVSMRLYLAASDICRVYLSAEKNSKANYYEDCAYRLIKDCVTCDVFSEYGYEYTQAKMKKDKAVVELPVRVNFCGSPSDAAPYCLEHGGTMIDGALLLNGKKPIRAVAAKIQDGIEFKSNEQGIQKHFTDIRDIQDCGNTSDPFALHKAVLLACGIVPLGGDTTMKEFCDSIEGGLSLETEAEVPKGSGLGTSSIIAAASVKAVFELMGKQADDEMVYARVFLAEQLMNTGGGWQDQVGGLTYGIKYFVSDPGIHQKIQVDTLLLKEEIKEELDRRFALVFSGQRRLARNVLRGEMNQLIRNDPQALDALRQIQEYCAVMRYHLLKGNITEFAHYVTRQFDLVKTLDKGASNACIEYIFDVCDDLIDGKSICGAGGGGFLQVILKEGVTKRQLQDRIEAVFADCGVEVWDCALI